jgi:hypothetical protein
MDKVRTWSSWVAVVAAMAALAVVPVAGTTAANPPFLPQSEPPVTWSAPAGMFVGGGSFGLHGVFTAAAVRRYSPLTLVLRGQAANVRTAVLQCDPDGGSIPDPKLACTELATVGGDFDRLPTDLQLFCMDYYQPVMAEAVGSWDGRPVDWAHEYPNICQLRRSTGAVFDFRDDLRP